MSDTRRILVVEDEVDLREIIVDLLTENHHEVHQAANGAEALEIVKKEEFTLILSDIKMPQMTGLEFFSQAQLYLQFTPVVFLTAFGDRDNMIKALQLGAFDFIKKPFDDAEVLGVVDRALEVGYRKKQIAQEIAQLDPDKKQRLERHHKMISLLHANNQKKRVS